MPIRTSMHAAAAEPISPELVLVCPELRERALELADRVQAHASRSYALAVLDLAETVRLGLAAFGSVTLVTFVLTLIANALH